MSNKKTAIIFDRVSKLYYLQSQKTFKEFLPAIFRGQKAGKHLWALKDINLEINKGETVGIIGRNGSGKSTLLKLIAGVTRPTKGEMSVNGKVSPLIELGAGFHPELSGRENVYLNSSILGISKSKTKKRFKEIVDFAELWDFIDTPVKYYSSGMYMRLGFSVAVNVEPEILLIDEILAVGDIAFQAKCLKEMEEFKKKKMTIILVSHSMETIKSFCNRAVYLKDGEAVTDGLPEEVVGRYLEEVK